MVKIKLTGGLLFSNDDVICASGYIFDRFRRILHIGLIFDVTARKTNQDIIYWLQEHNNSWRNSLSNGIMSFFWIFLVLSITTMVMTGNIEKNKIFLQPNKRYEIFAHIIIYTKQHWRLYWLYMSTAYLYTVIYHTKVNIWSLQHHHQFFSD